MASQQVKTVTELMCDVTDHDCRAGPDKRNLQSMLDTLRGTDAVEDDVTIMSREGKGFSSTRGLRTLTTLFVAQLLRLE